MRIPPPHSRLHPDRIKNGTGGRTSDPCTENGTRAGAETVPDMEPAYIRWPVAENATVTGAIRDAVQFDGVSLRDLAARTGVPKSTLSRFLNHKGGLNSDKLNTLAEYLGLSLTRRVNLAKHVDKLMANFWTIREHWWAEVNARLGLTGDGWQAEGLDAYGDDVAREEWREQFRPTFTAMERSRLEAIPWIVIVDETEVVQ